MVVKAERNGYRIVDDAPSLLRMQGIGLYAIEQQVCAANGVDVWWKQVYPMSGTSSTDLQKVTEKFYELTTK